MVSSTRFLTRDGVIHRKQGKPVEANIFERTGGGSEIVEVGAKKDNFDVELAFDTPKGVEEKTIETPLTPDQKSLRMQKGLALAQSAAGIANAVIEFEQIQSRAKTNIMLANAQFHESLEIGRQQALQAETAGFARGEQATLSAIAQGQEASGGIAQSAQLAEETLGVLNAITIENNAIRQAYGFKQEAALIEHERNIAEINRNAQIITSALSGAIALV